MKSQLSTMLEIWSAASFDAALACATSEVERSRDLDRLARLVMTRGLGVFTLDLPTLDALLLELLERGSVRFEGPLGVRRSKSDTRPRFLWGFWSLVCDESGCLKESPSVEAMFAIRQLSSLWKKLEVDCSPARQMAAVEEFYAIEESIPQPTLDWVGRSIDGHSELMFASFPDAAGAFSDPGFTRRLDKVAKLLVSGFPIFDSMSEDSPATGFFKHGPGAVSNLKRLEYKYSFPNWSESLERSFPFDWCSGTFASNDFLLSQDEPHSRLLAVPKTAKSPRLIASEPLEHQWCQQKVKTFMDHHIKGGLIGQFFDHANQKLSQLLVASASRDRSLATIDLSSASDRVRCSHVERLFASHPSLLQAFMDVRTQKVVDHVLKRYPERGLRKFTTMGSALTFPVQSIFFLSIALASAGAWDRGTVGRLVGKVRVFGDDIIIPNEAYAATVQNLTALGLKVNGSKSFHAGKFRESCGSDCWDGYDITPVKPKTSGSDALVSLQALLDTANNLFKKGYWRASNTILEMLPSRFTGLVAKIGTVAHESERGDWSDTDALGVVSFSGSYAHRLKYDRHLHRWYAPLVTIKSGQERVRQDNSFALREFLTRPWSPERARETGTKRSAAARFATVRVDAHALGLI